MNARSLCVTRTTLVMLLAAGAPAGAQTFQNTGSITINDNGPATPYPSSIVVSGLDEPVASITVSLIRLTHTFPDDIDILLVGPTGAAVLLMSDAGGAANAVNVNLTFADGAALLPDETAIVSGTYSPTNYGAADGLPPPAPGDAPQNALAAFAGTNGNGTWSLYIADDLAQDTGAVNGGWSITIVQEPPAPPVTYQGRLLQAGAPLTGDADLEFALFDAPAGGSQVFSTLAADAVPVIDGLFTVELPFSSTLFDGSERWLEVAVRSPAGSGSFTTLAPRQRVASAPEALHARRATTALAAGTAATAAAADLAQAAFTLAAPNGGPADVVVVDSSGNVGIGTATPARRLELADVHAFLRLTSTGTLNGADLELRNNSTQTLLGKISFLNSAGSIRGQLAYRGTDDAMTFLTTATERMRIDSAGNVGIGTNAPGTHRLQVTSAVESSEHVQFDSTADLASGQALLSLEATATSAGDMRFIECKRGSTSVFAVNGDGATGVGTNAPARKLHVSNGSSGGTPQAAADLLVEDDTTCYVNLMAPDASERGITFGSPANSVHGGVYYSNSAGLSLRTGGNQTAMVISANGNAAIGITGGSNDAALHVQNTSGATRPIKCDRVSTDGELLAWARDDSVIGNVTVAGGVVSYNAFTGSHYAWTDQPLERGTLVALTGVNRRMHEDRESEIMYGIAPAAGANDSRCIGAYLGVVDPARPPAPDNPHLVASVGNGDLWVVEAGADIEPGDALIASGIAGCAMKDDRSRFPVAHVVARAAEAVRWSDVSLEWKGIRRVRISVLFDRHTRGVDPATVAELSARLDALQQENAVMRARLERLERAADDTRGANTEPQQVQNRAR